MDACHYESNKWLQRFMNLTVKVKVHDPILRDVCLGLQKELRELDWTA